MSSKKIKLNRSVNSINSKPTADKKKASPKLKAILETPFQLVTEKLSNAYASELKEIIRIECLLQGGLHGKEFARANNISLGLGSSLNEISRRNVSWVLISMNIRPTFIIKQITYLSRQKNSTAPVHMVENLEALSEKMFGLKSSLIVFPTKLPAKLLEWFSKRIKPPKTTETVKKGNNFGNAKLLGIKKSSDGSNFEINCVFLQKEANGDRAFVPPKVETVKQKVNRPPEGFISLGRKTVESDTQTEKSSIHQNLKNKMMKLPKIVYEEYDSDYTTSYAVRCRWNYTRCLKNPKRRVKKS